MLIILSTPAGVQVPASSQSLPCLKSLIKTLVWIRGVKPFRLLPSFPFSPPSLSPFCLIENMYSRKGCGEGNMSEERRWRENQKLGKWMRKVGGAKKKRGNFAFSGWELEEPRISVRFCPSPLTWASAAALLLLFHLAVNVIKRLLIRAATEASARLSAPEPHLPSFPCLTFFPSVCMCITPLLSKFQHKALYTS